jgi:phosphoglucosamine mutase
MELFGTDGVRGRAGKFLDAYTALKLAQAAGIYFKSITKTKTTRILLGKDTRRSGYMIENALVSGFTSVGFDVIQIGPMPTPAIAYLTQSMRCDAGIMLSASHNSYEDNGVKFFNCNGDKLSNDIEKEIEKIFFNEKLLIASQVTFDEIGKAKRINDVIGRYIVSIKSSFPRNLSLNKMRIVLDCANGAAYKVGPTILDELGAELITINDKPDGFNINEQCGALHPLKLGKVVKETRADLGIALDGDADRLVIVDENGDVVDGDKLIGVLAVYLKSEGKLPSNSCVATVMSNIALEKYLKKNGIKLLRSAVGDKNVLDIMKKENINFGGEQSGHVIFSDVAKTGDGLASSLQVLALLLRDGKECKKASELLNPFELSPQILKNLMVEDKIPLDKIVGLDELLKSFRTQGLRDLIRYSGTENKIRLLLEGEDEELVSSCMEELSAFIKSKLC